MKTFDCNLHSVITSVAFAIFVILPGCKISDKPDSRSNAEKDISVRKTVTLSDNWRFQLDIRDIGEKKGWYKEDFDRNNWAKVTVPQAWDCYETALRGYEGIGWYSVTINAADFIPGRRTEIIFNRIMYYSKVWINGEFIGENIGGYLPFRFDVTKFLKPGQNNELAIRVDNKARIEWLPAAGQVEWIQYGGILQPVKLVSTSHTYIDDLTFRSDLADGKAQINCIAAVVNDSDAESGMELEIELSNGGDITKKSEKLLCKPHDTARLTITLPLDHPELWSPESPSLYEVKGKLKKDEAVIDDMADRIGIRKINIQGNTILLNGNPVTIKGVNRYDEYGNYGVNVPEEILRKELALMKSVGINTIRVHYPQSLDLLSLYDEFGFMMLEEVPLNWWGQTWFVEEVKMNLDILDQAKPALRKMIRRDKNHPCVIIWSMCNECRTDTDIGITVMRELLRLAKSLDPTRPVTFVANGNPMDHLGYDEADIVCFNKYYGTLEGTLCDNISQIDSLGFQPFVKELSLVRKSFINKPIFITEFGAQGIKNIHGDAPYSEEFQAAYIEKIWEGIRSVPGVSGGVLWCWADYYHRKYLITYNDYGPYGVVTVDRKPKKSLEALARMYGGTISR
jgi:beta-glucuronidase